MSNHKLVLLKLQFVELQGGVFASPCISYKKTKESECDLLNYIGDSYEEEIKSVRQYEHDGKNKNKNNSEFLGPFVHI